MVQKTDKLWVNLLSSNYSSGSNFFFNASAHRNNSPTWSPIVRAKNVLNHGYIWRAGSGNSSFWYSNWSPFGILGNQVPYVDIHDIHLTIKDVITNEAHHTQALYTILPTNLEEAVNNVRLSFNDLIEDAYI